MKILIVQPYSPFPVRRGSDRLIANLIRGVSARHEVVLATMALSDEQRAALAAVAGGNVSVRSITAPNKRSVLHRGAYKARNVLRALLGWIPMEVSYAAPGAFLDLVAGTARAERVDMVLASYWHLYALPSRLRGVPLVLVTHDVDYLVHAQRVRLASNNLKRLFIRIDASMKERIEKEAYRRYGCILALTERDAGVVRGMAGAGGKLVRTLPLAIDLDRYRPGEYKRDAESILFIGALDADFNRDALLYFVRDVFPLVAERMPRARLDVVGYGADKSLGVLAQPRIAFRGGAGDIRPHLGRCAIMVLPLRFGGGVRIRMMEAAAMGIPVVSTPAGVAGMGLVSGSDYLEASSPAEMSDAIVRLLGDGDLRERIGGNARLWAEARISMRDYPDRLEALFSELCSSDSKSRM